MTFYGSGLLNQQKNPLPLRQWIQTLCKRLSELSYGYEPGQAIPTEGFHDLSVDCMNTSFFLVNDKSRKKQTNNFPKIISLVVLLYCRCSMSSPFSGGILLIDFRIILHKPVRVTRLTGNIQLRLGKS